MITRILMLALLLAFGQAQAEDYPARTIKIIVGFGPGGVADSTARIVAVKLSENMGKSVIVENMPGAGGIPPLWSAGGIGADAGIGAGAPAAILGSEPGGTTG